QEHFQLFLLLVCTPICIYKSVMNMVPLSDGGLSTISCILYQPFCGSDGKTYNNKCSFCKAVLRSRGALRMKQAGAC
uniref:Ovomucoid n=1 Tax=Calidris pygmaea TaxID=425635 RepID=A0A8C3JG47_9CHAR